MQHHRNAGERRRYWGGVIGKTQKSAQPPQKISGSKYYLKKDKLKNFQNLT